MNPELQEIQSSQIPKSAVATAAELVRAKTGESRFITTNAFEGRKYAGELFGIIDCESHLYAVHRIGEGRLILHNVRREDIPALDASIGQNAEITSDYEGILNIVDSGRRSEQLERNKWRGR